MSITVQYTSSTPGWKKSYLATHCLRMPMLLEWFFDKDDKVSMMKMIISMIKMIMAQWQGNVLDDGTNQIRFGKWFFIITNTLKISFTREICCKDIFSSSNNSRHLRLAICLKLYFCPKCPKQLRIRHERLIFALPVSHQLALCHPCTLSSNYLSMLSFIFRFEFKWVNDKFLGVTLGSVPPLHTVQSLPLYLCNCLTLQCSVISTILREDNKMYLKSNMLDQPLNVS